MKILGKLGLMLGGAAIGVYGTKILGSKSMKKAYSHVTAGALWLKDEIIRDVTIITENCEDIAADAKEINSKMQAERDARKLQDAKDLVANSTPKRTARTKK